jgi:predicted AlkP superfamily pyrophosphatase or phosphodiesterase
VRHDYLDRVSLPALARIEAEGLRAERLIPVFPSTTFPNHIALATGARTDRHGIINNVFYDRDRGLYDHGGPGYGDWLEAEPIWAAAERQGLRAGIFFWVGSDADWHGHGATYRKVPFDPDVGEAEKVEQILAWIDLPREMRPQLIMAWWHGADGVGHRKGPDHPDIATQMRSQDLQLGALLAGIDAREGWGHTTLIVVSDHGMTEFDEVVPVQGPLDAAGVAARVIPGAATAHIFLDDPADLDRAYEVLAGISQAEVYRGDALPASLRLRHPKRTGDLVMLAEPPRTLYEVRRFRGALRWLVKTFFGWDSGAHGYSPDYPDMGAILLAVGRGVKPGTKLGPTRNIDIAPTIARLLGIDPPAQSEGRPIDAFVVSP